MSGKGYDEMVGRAINDPGFRARLLKDPEATLAEEGFHVTPEVLETLKNIDPAAANQAIETATNAVGDRRSAT